MLEPLTRLIEVVGAIVCLCGFTPLAVYLWYGGNPPAKIEMLLERYTKVFECGTNSLFSRFKRKDDIIDITSDQTKKLSPPKEAAQ